MFSVQTLRCKNLIFGPTWLSGKEYTGLRQEMEKARAQSLCREAPLEEEMATHSSALAWEIPWTEEPGGLQSMELQRVRHDCARTHACMFYIVSCLCLILFSIFLFSDILVSWGNIHEQDFLWKIVLSPLWHMHTWILKIPKSCANKQCSCNNFSL